MQQQPGVSTKAMRNFFKRRPWPPVWLSAQGGGTEGFRHGRVGAAQVKSSTGIPGRCGCRRSSGSTSAPAAPVHRVRSPVDHARSRQALACRLRAHPRPDPRALRWQRCWCDRGVAMPAARSSRELLHTPNLTPGERLRCTGRSDGSRAPAWLQPPTTHRAGDGEFKAREATGGEIGWSRARLISRAGLTQFAWRSSICGDNPLCSRHLYQPGVRSRRNGESTAQSADEAGGSWSPAEAESFETVERLPAA